MKSAKLHEGIRKIGMGAFNGSALEAIEIPGSVSEIDYRTFSQCPNLKCVNLNEGLTKILQTSFNDCPLLSSIIIPKSVTLINNDAFKDCKSLSDVTILGTPLVRDDAFKGTPWGETEVAQEILDELTEYE